MEDASHLFFYLPCSISSRDTPTCEPTKSYKLLDAACAVVHLFKKDKKDGQSKGDKPLDGTGIKSVARRLNPREQSNTIILTQNRKALRDSAVTAHLIGLVR